MRYRLYRRTNGVFYCHNNENGKQESLKTIVAGHQKLAREWWNRRRPHFECFVFLAINFGRELQIL